MNFIKKKLALAIGSSLIAMSVLVSGCSTGSDKKADTIKIGVVAELTGNNATYGTSITNGIKLAVQQLNDTGGLQVQIYCRQRPVQFFSQAGRQYHLTAVQQV